MQFNDRSIFDPFQKALRRLPRMAVSVILTLPYWGYQLSDLESEQGSISQRPNSFQKDVSFLKIKKLRSSRSILFKCKRTKSALIFLPLRNLKLAVKEGDHFYSIKGLHWYINAKTRSGIFQVHLRPVIVEFLKLVLLSFEMCAKLVIV